MKKRIIRYLLAIAAIIMIFEYRFVGVGHANTDLPSKQMSYQELNIQVMPEYVTPPGWKEGEPAILNVYQGLYINEEEEAFEGSFSMAIPLDEPSFVLGYVGQYKGEDVIDIEFTLNEKEKRVEWSTDEPIPSGEQYRFIVEYYYAPFGAEKEREFTFNHLSEIDVDSMRIFFFEPVGATNVELSVEPVNVVDMFGAPVHQYEFQDVKAGDGFKLEVSYEKDSTITTMEALEQQMMPNDDIHQGMDKGSSNGGQLISNESAIMISVSIIIAGVFIFLGLRNRKKGPSNNPKQVVKSRKKDDALQSVNVADEKKRLRQQLINGQIDEETYQRKLSKLS